MAHMGILTVDQLRFAERKTIEHRKNKLSATN